MRGHQRISNLIGAILSLALALILVTVPDYGLVIVAAILGIAWILRGIRMLFFYFTKARHMVSGRMTLYLGVVFLDLGMFILTLTNIPRIYLAIYLLVIHAFTGAIEVLRGFEAKKLKDSSWLLNIISGAFNIIIAVLCVVFVRSTAMIMLFYSIGLVISAVSRIIKAFRKTAIVYIQ